MRLEESGKIILHTDLISPPVEQENKFREDEHKKPFISKRKSREIGKMVFDAVEEIRKRVGRDINPRW